MKKSSIGNKSILVSSSIPFFLFITNLAKKQLLIALIHLRCMVFLGQCSFSPFPFLLSPSNQLLSHIIIKMSLSEVNKLHAVKTKGHLDFLNCFLVSSFSFSILDLLVICSSVIIWNSSPHQLTSLMFTAIQWCYIIPLCQSLQLLYPSRSSPPN